MMKRFLGGARKTASTFLGVNYYGRIRFKKLKRLGNIYRQICLETQWAGFCACCEQFVAKT